MLPARASVPSRIAGGERSFISKGLKGEIRVATQKSGAIIAAAFDKLLATIPPWALKAARFFVNADIRPVALEFLNFAGENSVRLLHDSPCFCFGLLELAREARKLRKLKDAGTRPRKELVRALVGKKWSNASVNLYLRLLAEKDKATLSLPLLRVLNEERPQLTRKEAVRARQKIPDTSGKMLVWQACMWPQLPGAGAFSREGGYFLNRFVELKDEKVRQAITLRAWRDGMGDIPGLLRGNHLRWGDVGRMIDMEPDKARRHDLLARAMAFRGATAAQAAHDLLMGHHGFAGPPVAAALPDDTPRPPLEASERGTLVEEDPDGFRVWRLTKAEKVTLEGRAMQHCVSVYGHSVETGMRDLWHVEYTPPEGEVEHATCMAGVESGFVEQFYGVHNHPVSDAMFDWMQAYLSLRGVTLTRDATTRGRAVFGGGVNIAAAMAEAHAGHAGVMAIAQEVYAAPQPVFEVAPIAFAPMEFAPGVMQGEIRVNLAQFHVAPGEIA